MTITQKQRKLRSPLKSAGPTEVKSAAGDWPPLPPNINREDPPEFHRMSFTRFEEMTCALLDKEPGVTRADLHNTRFDAQYGIDCFGDLPGGMIVASCKCQKSIKKDEMAKWSEDFLQHWEAIWKKQGVSKFILSTAAPTEHRNRLADIATQKNRFEAIGVEYEVWSPRQLQEHLHAIWAERFVDTFEHRELGWHVAFIPGEAQFRATMFDREKIDWRSINPGAERRIAVVTDTVGYHGPSQRKGDHVFIAWRFFLPTKDAAHGSICSRSSHSVRVRGLAWGL